MKKEIRVFVINVNTEDKKFDKYTDEEFMKYAEEQDGNDSGEGVYTLKQFQLEFNVENIITEHTYCRFIEVEANK